MFCLPLPKSLKKGFFPKSSKKSTPDFGDMDFKFDANASIKAKAPIDSSFLVANNNEITLLSFSPPENQTSNQSTDYAPEGDFTFTDLFTDSGKSSEDMNLAYPLHREDDSDIEIIDEQDPNNAYSLVQPKEQEQDQSHLPNFRKISSTPKAKNILKFSAKKRSLSFSKPQNQFSKSRLDFEKFTTINSSIQTDLLMSDTFTTESDSTSVDWETGLKNQQNLYSNPNTAKIGTKYQAAMLLEERLNHLKTQIALERLVKKNAALRQQNLVFKKNSKNQSRKIVSLQSQASRSMRSTTLTSLNETSEISNFRLNYVTPKNNSTKLTRSTKSKNCNSKSVAWSKRLVIDSQESMVGKCSPSKISKISISASRSKYNAVVKRTPVRSTPTKMKVKSAYVKRVSKELRTIAQTEESGYGSFVQMGDVL